MILTNGNCIVATEGTVVWELFQRSGPRLNIILGGIKLPTETPKLQDDRRKKLYPSSDCCHF